MKVRHTAVIPFGGNIITEDIKHGLGVMKKQAEKLKTEYGSALAIETSNNDIIRIPGLKGRDAKEVSVKNLANIIEARVEEILEQVSFEIKSSGFANQLIGGIVITGGGSQLKHLKQHVEYITGMDTRIGYPIEHLDKNANAAMRSPMYATSLGLVLLGFEDVRKNYIEEYEEEEEVIQQAPPMADEMQANATHQESVYHAHQEREHVTTKNKRSWLDPIKNWFRIDAEDFEE